MKTSDAAVLDEPKFMNLLQMQSWNRQLKVARGLPQWASRTRRFTSTENFTRKRTQEFPSSTTGFYTATEFSRASAFTMGECSGLENTLSVCGTRRTQSAWKFQ